MSSCSFVSCSYTNSFISYTFTPPVYLDIENNARVQTIRTDVYQTPNAYIIDLNINTSLSLQLDTLVQNTCSYTRTKTPSSSLISVAYECLNTDLKTLCSKWNGCVLTNSSLSVENIYVRKNPYTAKLASVTPTYRLVL